MLTATIVRETARRPIFGTETDSIVSTLPRMPEGETTGFIALFLARVVQIFAGIATTLCVLMIIYAGVRMILSFGNDDTYKKSWAIMRRALTGLLLAIFAFVLVQLVLLVGERILQISL